MNANLMRMNALYHNLIKYNTTTKMKKVIKTQNVSDELTTKQLNMFNNIRKIAIIIFNN